MQFLKSLAKKLRAMLRRHPLIYAFVGGVGVVLFWRGVWHFTDFLALILFPSSDQVTTIDWTTGIDSSLSLVIGTLLLLLTGLFVSEFLTGQVLMTDIKEEERLVKTTEKDIAKESSEFSPIEKDLQHIEEEIKNLENQVRKK
jgi:hypothetical protein